MKHKNVPVFIPHVGCPNDCVFCNQRRISGKMDFDIHTVQRELEDELSTVDTQACDAEIAFFGGSFTGIDRGDMLYLLGLAKEHVDAGRVSAIRLSTRPDYIDGEILDILAAHGVTDIELGLQSMSERVLAAAKRGHTAECAREACRLIKSRGFNLVGQMMIGLPESMVDDEIATAKEIVSLGCDAARIYSTVVFRDTELAEMTARREYTPLTMQDAIERSAAVLRIFTENSVPVIRLGLCAADNLFEEGTMVGGAYHSAFGEMVYSELYYKKIREYIEENSLAEKIRDRSVTVYVPRGEVSKVAGQKRANKTRICGEYGARSVKIIERADLDKYSVIVEV